MKNLIYKYPIPIQDDFTIDFPVSGRILHVDVQRGAPYLWVWITGSPEDTQPKDFKLFGTGIKYESDEHLNHLGSFLLNEGTFVGHVFEVVEY